MSTKRSKSGVRSTRKAPPTISSEELAKEIAEIESDTTFGSTRRPQIEEGEEPTKPAKTPIPLEPVESIPVTPKVNQQPPENSCPPRNKDDVEQRLQAEYWRYQAIKFLPDGWNYWLNPGVGQQIASTSLTLQDGSIVKFTSATQSTFRWFGPRMTPGQCIETGSRYLSTLRVTAVHVVNGEEKRHKEFKCGDFPLMLGSKLCMTQQARNEKELEALGVDPLDPPGMFIIDGAVKKFNNEKQLQFLTPHVYTGPRLQAVREGQQKFALQARLTYARPLGNSSIAYAEIIDRKIMVYLPFLDKKMEKEKGGESNLTKASLTMPVFSIIRLFNKLQPGREIAEENDTILGSEDYLNQILRMSPPEWHAKMREKLQPSLVHILGSEEHNEKEGIASDFKYYNDQTKLNWSNRLLADKFRNGFRDTFFTYIQPKYDNAGKVINNYMQERFDTFCFMIAQLVEVMCDLRKPTNRNDWSENMVTHAGVHMARLFANAWGSKINLIQAEKASKTKNFDEIVGWLEDRKPYDISETVATCFRTGKWGIGNRNKKQNVTVPLKQNNITAAYGDLGLINTISNDKSRDLDPRKVIADALGMIDPNHTPESGRCGLVNSLTIGAMLSQPRDDTQLRIDVLPFVHWPSDREKFPDECVLFINGVLVGWCDPVLEKEAKAWKLARRPVDMAVVRKHSVIYLNTTGNRPLRPLLVVDETDHKLKIDKVTIGIKSKSGQIVDPRPAWNATFPQLVAAGCIELLDATEQQWVATVATRYSNVLDWERRVAELDRRRSLFAEEIRILENLADTGVAGEFTEEERREIATLAQASFVEQEKVKVIQLLYQKLTAEEKEKLRALKKSTAEAKAAVSELAKWKLTDKEKREIMELAEQAYLVEPPISEEPTTRKEAEEVERQAKRIYEKDLSPEAQAKSRAYWAIEGLKSLTKEAAAKSLQREISSRKLMIIDIEKEKNRLATKHVDGHYVIRRPYTHTEMNPRQLLSSTAALIPFSNMSPPVRITYECKQSGQNIGIISSVAHRMLGTTMKSLVYPRRGLIETELAKVLGLSERPVGDTVLMGIVDLDSWPQEDSFVINQNLFDTGYYAYYVHKTYTVELIHDRSRDGYYERIRRPKRRPGDRGDKYAALNEDGLPMIHQTIRPKMAICGKVKLRKLPSGAEDPEFEEDVSLIAGPNDLGYVEKVIVVNPRSPQTMSVTIVLRRMRVPRAGDKFSFFPGQKGTISFIAPTVDMPYTQQGRALDVLMNPLAFTTRMTMGLLLEPIASTFAAVIGRRLNASTFQRYDRDTFERILQDVGFHFQEKQKLFHPYTGKLIECSIFTGLAYMKMLAHNVLEKIRSRSDEGRIDPVTRQPVGGKAQDEDSAVKSGEMERDCMIAHGASGLLHERYYYSSDRDHVPFCLNKECGTFAVANIKARGAEGEIRCFNCGQSRFGEVKLPHIYKVFIDIMARIGIRYFHQLRPRRQHARLETMAERRRTMALP
jgi:DNA-directed RNA polymerase beta subunit